MTKHNGNRSLSTKDLRSLINTTTPIAYAMHTNENAEMSEKKTETTKPFQFISSTFPMIKWAEAATNRTDQSTRIRTIATALHMNISSSDVQCKNVRTYVVYLDEIVLIFLFIRRVFVLISMLKAIQFSSFFFKSVFSSVVVNIQFCWNFHKHRIKEKNE